MFDFRDTNSMLGEFFFSKIIKPKVTDCLSENAHQWTV